MFTCEVCGSTDFQKDAGYLYCNDCQSQSQHYQEQESEMFIMASQISVPKKKKKEKVQEKITVADLWTSWDALNFILYGMTQELKNLSFAPEKLEEVVLQLWACQLQKSEVAFISRMNEKKPKLGYYYRSRDSRILYGQVNLTKKKRDKKISNDILSHSTNLSTKKIKRRFIEKHLENYSLSESQIYAAENIDALAPCISPTDPASERISFRNIFTSRDYIIYQKHKHSLKNNSVRYAKRMMINYFCKNKLLGIIHLALLLLGSNIQLGDLLRFIRESHISFAKVTHFLPEEIKLSKGDAAFLETISDALMPTNLKQRQIGRYLARCFRIYEVPLPDIRDLLTRYCQELNLPDIIVKYSEKILKHVRSEKLCKLRGKKYLPSFEALAVASIIFIMKLFFGLDGITEFILSDLASKINRISQFSGKKLFVFKDWQTHLECRKAVLKDFNYTIDEKLNSNLLTSSKGYMDHLTKESKDEFRDRRFKSYSQYYMDPKILKSVKDVLDTLKEPLDYTSVDFSPTLTPYSSYLDKILQIHEKENIAEICASSLKILKNDFKTDRISFVTNPELYSSILKRNNFDITKMKKSELIKRFNLGTWKGDENLTTFFNSNNVIFIENPLDYWIVKCSSPDNMLMEEFENELFCKFPVNFRWILIEGSRMLEMNEREIYNELTFIEKNVKSLIKH